MDNMHTVLTARTTLRSSGLSIVIAVLASFTALTLAGRVKESAGRARTVWLIGAATAFGGGIWSMHFVAMLAFSLDMPIQYNVGLTIDVPGGGDRRRLHSHSTR